ncbi:unnamed protein product [Discula destructiva]
MMMRPVPLELLPLGQEQQATFSKPNGIFTDDADFPGAPMGATVSGGARTDIEGRGKAAEGPSSSAQEGLDGKLGKESSGKAKKSTAFKATLAKIFKRSQKSEDTATAEHRAAGGTKADIKGKRKAAEGPSTSMHAETAGQIETESAGEATESNAPAANTSRDTPDNELDPNHKPKIQASTEDDAGPSSFTKEGQTVQNAAGSTIAANESADGLDKGKDQTAQIPAESAPVANKAAAGPDKSKSLFSGLFKRSQKRQVEELNQDIDATASSLAKLSAAATNAAGDIKRNVGLQNKFSEGPMSAESKAEALKRYRDLLESGVQDPLTTLLSAKNYGALDDIVELPPARAHSMSEDTVPIAKKRSKSEHSLSSAAAVSQARATLPVHLLAHDKVINAQPSERRGPHRLSADAMVPVRVAASSHDIEADPTISSGPQLLFSHELLDDIRVLRPKSPQPHILEVDRKLAESKKHSSPHSLHSDAIIASPQPRAAHRLYSDPVVASGTSARKEHDTAHDVRILSPSGTIRDPHVIEDDEIIKENAIFRKSPIPDAAVGAG